MKPLRAIAALPLMLLAAATPPAEPWTVFGLRLGEPVSLPMCPKKVVGGRVSTYLYEDDPAETCHEPDRQLRGVPWRRGSVNFPLQRMPLILHINSGFTLIADGRLEGLNFETLDHTNTDAILTELTGKFGPPSSVTRTVGGPTGVGLPAVHAEWKLRGLYVSYRNIDRSIEYGTLDIETPAMRALRGEREAQQARERTAL